MNLSWLGIFGAGLLTFLSPCVLPLAPFLTASLVTSDGSRLARVKSTAWFGLGFTLVFILLGMGASWAGAALGQARPWLYLAGALVTLLFGLKMMGAVKAQGPLAWMERSLRLPDLTKRLPGGLQGLAFGAIFGVGWTPCVGPVLGSVLTYVASTQVSPLKGAAMLAVFSLGLMLPLFGVALGLDRARDFLLKLRPMIPKIENAAGLGLSIFAVLLGIQAVQLLRETPHGTEARNVMAETDRHLQINLGPTSVGQARMVFFYRTNCPFCHEMEKYLGDFEKKCSSANFQLARVNVDFASNSRASDAFNVRVVPTISLLDASGVEVMRLVGYQGEARLREAARSLTSLVCQTPELHGKPAEPEAEPVTPAGCSVNESC